MLLVINCSSHAVHMGVLMNTTPSFEAGGWQTAVGPICCYSDLSRVARISPAEVVGGCMLSVLTQLSNFDSHLISNIWKHHLSFCFFAFFNLSSVWKTIASSQTHSQCTWIWREDYIISCSRSQWVKLTTNLCGKKVSQQIHLVSNIAVNM